MAIKFLDDYRTPQEEIDRAPARTLVWDVVGDTTSEVTTLDLKRLEKDVIITDIKSQVTKISAGTTPSEILKVTFQRDGGAVETLYQGTLDGTAVGTDPALPVPYKTPMRGTLAVELTATGTITTSAEQRVQVTCLRVDEPT